MKIRRITKKFQHQFEEVYSEHFNSLFIYARSLAKSEDLAKDAVSEVFFSLWKSKTDFSRVLDIQAYLFRAVKNEVVRILSHDHVNFQDLNTDINIQRVERLNPEELLLEKELLDIISQAVSQLPDQCRLIFDMAKNQRMSYTEIAGELLISKSTVKTQVSRALATIRQVIEKSHDEKRESYSNGWGASTAVIFAFLITSII